MRRCLVVGLGLLVACAAEGTEGEQTEDALLAGCAVGSPCSERPLDPMSPWPKFRGNMKQDGRSGVRPRQSDRAPWSFKTGKGIFSTPVIDGKGNVYVGSADTNFYALSDRGELRWKVKNGEIIDSSALLDDRGLVYYGAGDGFVRALETSDGREVWRFAAASPESTGAYINWFEGNIAIGTDGTLYAPNDNRHIYGIDRTTGRSKTGWPWTMNDQTWSSPAIDPATGNLFMGNNYIAGYAFMMAVWRNTFALTPDGREVWGTGVQATVAASPMISDGRMIVGAFDGYVRAYDLTNGRTLWSFATNDHVYASPGRLSDGTVIQPSADGSVYALDPQTGAKKWQFDTGEPIRSSPAIDADDNVYFGGGDGRLYVLNKNGTLRFKRRLIKEDRNDFGSSPALGHDFVVIAGESGEIFATPYDWCLRTPSDPDCETPPAPSDGVRLSFTTPLGSVLAEAPSKIEANAPLAFSLSRHERGKSELALVDESTLRVTVDPPVPVDVDTSGDRRFITVVPKTRFAGQRTKITIAGSWLQNPERQGLLFSGGTRGGTFATTFDFELGAGGPAAELPVPAKVGDPSAVFELSRIAVPYPTVLPSYNQIGFDSLHYLVGMVEGSATKRIGWVVGGKLGADGVTAEIDPATEVLFPVETSYEDGLLNLVNEAGFSVRAMNFDMPFDTFRVSAHLGADGIPVSQPGVHVKTKCGNIPFYGPFLAKLGFCNPTSDVLDVFGATNLRPHAGGVALPPAGIGTVRFVKNTGGWATSSIMATISGSSLKLADHAFGLLLVDADTGKPVSLKYGLKDVTSRTQTAGGEIATVTVKVDSPPRRVRAHLLVDTYPVATGLLE